MDSVPHPEMKKLAQKIVDPELDVVEKRKVMEEFKNFDHGGENDFTKVDYNELIDKFIDPNLPDHEYKPTMKALLEGDLDQERKNQVIEIINCHDKEQKAKMVKRFKSFFDRDREEKERAEAERAKELEAKRLAKLKAKEEEANLLVFTDDGMSLIMKMLDKKIAREKKTEIYDRLMEPDIDAEIKNVALQMVSLGKQSERVQYVEDFKKRREEEKIAEEKRKKEAEQRKIEEENARKEQKMMRKNELLARKNKDERMKKRELMLKMRADERRRESQYVGPSSVQEREEQRRKERERVKEEMKRYKEKTLRDMKRAEREDMRREGWMVLPFDGNLNFNVKVLVPDLNSNLNESERAEFEKAKAKMKQKMAESKAGVMESKAVEASADRKSSIESGANNSTGTGTDKVEEDPEFTKFFEIFSNPSLTEEEEKAHITALIKEGKGVLVRKLVAKLVSIPGVGKCVIFKSLAKKLGLTPTQPQTQVSATVQVKSSEESNELSNPIKESKTVEKSSENSTKKVDVASRASEEKKTPVIESRICSSGEVDAVNMKSETTTKEQINSGTNGHDKDSVIVKRKLSCESDSEEKNKKIKSSGEHEDSETKKRKRLEDDDDSDDKKKKKKKKHKHNDDKERDKSKKDIYKEKEKREREDGSKQDKHNENELLVTKENSTVRDKETSLSQTTEEIVKPTKPIMSMTMTEIKTKFELSKIDSYVKIKNCSILAKAIKRQDNIRDKLWKEKREKEAIERKEKLEVIKKIENSASNGRTEEENSLVKSASNSPGRSRSNSSSKSNNRSLTPVSSLSKTTSLKLKSPLNDVKSKSVSKSRSPSLKTKSRSASRSMTSPERSRSNSAVPRSRSRSRSESKPKSKPTSVVNSRSPSRSRSNSKARSLSKSVPPRSRSPSIPARSKSPSRSRSPILSRSNSRSYLSLSRSRSRSVTKSRSVSRSRSISKSRSVSRSRSKSISR